jgi:hypothetical protein
MVYNDSGQYENRNGTSLLRIQTGVDQGHIDGSLFGDTLRVWVDFSNCADEPSPKLRGWAAQSINLTFDAVIEMAYESRTGYDYERAKPLIAEVVDIEVRGPDEYKELARAVSFEAWLARRPR